MTRIFKWTMIMAEKINFTQDRIRNLPIPKKQKRGLER